MVNGSPPANEKNGESPGADEKKEVAAATVEDVTSCSEEEGNDEDSVNTNDVVDMFGGKKLGPGKGFARDEEEEEERAEAVAETDSKHNEEEEDEGEKTDKSSGEEDLSGSAFLCKEIAINNFNRCCSLGRCRNSARGM